MEKTKKYFKISCYGVLVYAVISMISLVIPFIRGIGAKDYYPDLSEDMAVLALCFAIFFAIVSSLVHIWLALWGMRSIKNNSAGVGISVLEFILSILAFFNLYAVIGGFIGTKDIVGSVIDLIYAVIWIAVLLFFDWHAIHFIKACREKNETVGK